jgi:hypothetical protein
VVGGSVDSPQATRRLDTKALCHLPGKRYIRYKRYSRSMTRPAGRLRSAQIRAASVDVPNDQRQNTGLFRQFLLRCNRNVPAARRSEQVVMQ